MIGAIIGQEPETNGEPNIYQSIKRALSRKYQNSSQRHEEKATVSASGVKDPNPQRQTLANVQLPDQEICDTCKALRKGTYEELEALQETCERRKADGSPCFVPVSIVQPTEELRALKMELAKVLPTAQLRGRSSRYILVRYDSRTESSNEATYSQVLYDSISTSPSPSWYMGSPTMAVPIRTYAPGVICLLEGEDSEGRRSRSRSRSRSQSPPIPVDYGRMTAQISGMQETTTIIASGSVPKLK